MTPIGPKPAGLRRLASLLVVSAAIACSSSDQQPTQQPGPRAFALHYHRPVGDYAGWTLVPTAGAAVATVSPSGFDAFGAEYVLTVSGNELAFSLQNGGATDAAGTVSVNLAGGATSAYVFSGRSAAFLGPLPALPGAHQLALYYVRPDADYAGWGLHVWGDQVAETAWASPLAPAGIHPVLGAGFIVPITASVPGNCTPGSVCLIAHRGNDKDPGPDMTFDPRALGSIVFLTSGSATLTSAPVPPSGPTISGAAAHLLSRSSLVWNATDPAATRFELRWSLTAGVHSTGADVVGGAVIALTPDPNGLSTALQALAPHLATRRAFKIASADLAALESALDGQLVAVARRADGSFHAATQVQTAFALDDLYPYDGPLGLSFSGGAPTFRLWAPTAQAVKLRVFDGAKAELAGSPFEMTPGLLGLWSRTGPSAWTGQYYQYEVQVYHPATSRIETLRVTDPWAVSLSTNSRYAQIVDLADPALAPAGWADLVKPPLDAFEDVVIYEAHVRDFSARDASAPAPRRGRLLAFEPEGATTSDGLLHLKALAAAGLTHLHLLPAFDFATVDEDPAARVELDDLVDLLGSRNAQVPAAFVADYAGSTIAWTVASFAGGSDRQQAVATWMKELDGFNWGYDPLHFGVPEGSYASSAEGTARIVEFRRMVMGLARLGVRVVMDVVYNHTNASGVGERSVLDKVVPGYYHRRDPDTGAVLTSTCCANTATEHRMMERLMIDTALRWAREYKVDGFRLDLMGHHMRSNLLRLRAALDALAPGTDGVDGAKLFLYGEGWDFGEVQNGARGVNATQLNLAGTGIGTFNDRIRDAVRGGGPFDGLWSIRRRQGFATGLWFDPNELGTPTEALKLELLAATDRLKVGMAGNLADFRLLGSFGYVRAGSQFPYNDAPTGYTQDPQEAINYVSAHDNQVLFDVVQAKLPAGRAMSDRVRAQIVALAAVALGQGVPFFHMGDDLLRSKSMDKNSYDSGDWFNRVDWTGATCAWASGRPRAGDNQTDWPLIDALFADTSIAPAAADIALSRDRFRELLRIRKSSPLFRLRTKADVTTRVDFLNGGPSQTPGVVVMTLTDGTCAGADLDPARDALVVILNAGPVSQVVTVPGATGFTLHPVLAASADPVARTASVSGEVFTVPARTAAVFEQAQGGTRGAGLPCNTR